MKTSRVDGVKAPQPFKTPRYAPESSSAFVASSWPSWISFRDSGLTLTTTLTHSPSFFLGTKSSSPFGGMAASGLVATGCWFGGGAARCAARKKSPDGAACARLARARGSRTKAIRSARRSTGRPQYKFRAGSEAPRVLTRTTACRRDVVPAPAVRPPGAPRASPLLARARSAAPSFLGTTADPVLGRSRYPSAAGSARSARLHAIKTGFPSRFYSRSRRASRRVLPVTLIST
jgi:hypothetical protein